MAGYEGFTPELIARFLVTATALPAGQTTAVATGTATVYSSMRGYYGDPRPREINHADNSGHIALTILPALNLFP